VVTAARLHARRALRAGGFVAITGAMLPPFVARFTTARAHERDAIRDAWVRRWSDALLALFAVTIDVGGEAPRAGRGQLVFANHRSTIDVALLLRTFGGRMVSRADLSGWPIVGAAARSVGTIFVDRASAASGAGTIRAIRDVLKAGGTVCVFPEGTTYDGDEVRPFHAGAFVAALKARAAIVPVGLAYERSSGAAFVDEPFLAHLERMSIAAPSSVSARIGASIDAGRYSRAADLAEHARATVAALVAEARAAVDAKHG
jgi:1-acyl-sn-glycerol-3-phosphate acyltransferase